MALTYTETQTHIEKTEKTLVVPSNWGMYTAKGNQRMKDMADSFVGKLEKANSYTKQLRAFEEFFKTYNKARKSKSPIMFEANDTAVRESVWEFARKVARMVEIDYPTLNRLWKESR